MEQTPIKIKEVITTEYSDFLEYCSMSGKIFVTELTSVDFIAYRFGYGQSKERVSKIKEILNAGIRINPTTEVSADDTAADNNMKDYKQEVYDTTPNQVLIEDGDAIVAKAEKNNYLVLSKDDKDIEDTTKVLHPEEIPLFQVFHVDPARFENVNINKLTFSVRPTNCLNNSSNHTVADLLRLCLSDLFQIRNMGAKSVNEVVSVLKDFVLSYTPQVCQEEQEQTGISKELQKCIEDYLLDDAYDIALLSEQDRQIFSEIVISADVLGKDLCLDAYCDVDYTRKILDMFREFAEPYIAFRKCIDPAEKQICALTPAIKEKKLLPFIWAFTASTERSLNDLVEICDKDTKVVSILSLFKLLREKENIDEISKDLNYFMRWLSFDIDIIISDITNQITNLLAGKKSRPLDIFAMHNNGRTLEEIGQELGVTRERVRQIEMKAYKTFWNVYSRQQYDLIMLVYSLRNGDGVIYYNELVDMLEDFAHMLWSCVKKMPQSDFYYYERELDAIVVKGNLYVKKNDELIKGINSAIATLPEIIHCTEFDTTISEIVMQFSIPEEPIRNYAKRRYKLDGQFYHNYRITVPFMCSYVLKERFPAGFKIADKYEGERFKEFLIEFFGDSAKNITNRALDAKVAEVGCLCDRGKYIHPDYLNIEQSLIDAINDYVEQSSRTAISFREVYEALKHLFAGTQISNRYVLQGALKKYGCRYKTTRDLIRKKDSVTIATELNDFVMERGRVHISDITAEFLNLSELNLFQIIARCPGVLYEENGYYFHDSLLDILQEDYKEIRPFLTQICETVPIHSKVLFNKFSLRFDEFMLRNEIDTAGKLFSILSYMFGDELSFSKPYVAQENADAASVRKVLLQLIEDYDTLSIDEILDICNDNNISYNSVTSHIQWLAPEWLKVDSETVVKREYTGVTDDTIDEVVSIINEALESCDYVIASSINNFICFPEIDIDWSSHLVECIMKATKKVCCISYPFNRHGKPSTIYVSDKYKDCRYENFIVSILADELHRGSFSTKEDMREWLIEKDLIDTGLPKFLREEKYFYCDEKGVLRYRKK